MRQKYYNFSKDSFYDFDQDWDDDFEDESDDDFWRYSLEDYRDDEEEEDYKRKFELHKNKFSSFKNDFFMRCPLCNNLIQNSEYLADNFEKQPYSYWSACLVTHYRHNHINYYDASWKNPYYSEKNREYNTMSHDEYRTIVNNRAKRQLIRGIVKNNTYDLETKIRLVEGFKALQFNDEKTNTVIEKKNSNAFKKKLSI